MASDSLGPGLAGISHLAGGGDRERDLGTALGAAFGSPKRPAKRLLTRSCLSGSLMAASLWRSLVLLPSRLQEQSFQMQNNTGAQSILQILYQAVSLRHTIGWSQWCMKLATQRHCIQCKAMDTLRQPGSPHHM